MATVFQRIKSPVSLALLFIAIILLFADYNFRWKNDQWKYAVHTDAADYYRYLPMVLIEHQLDDPAENPAVIKYFVGTAMLYSPFFAIACAGSAVCGLPVDGYSVLFPVLISIGTLFYLLSGLFFFSKFLRYYITREWIICMMLAAIAFATTAWYYTVNAPGWAHIPAFALVCFLLYHLKKLAIHVNRKSIIAIIAASSFLFFTRPTDVIILVVAPFLFTDGKAFFEALKKIIADKKALLIGIGFALVPLVCQLAVYKASSGKFITWSYTKEGFDFLNPEMMNVLFSYAKGFFIYTPICFLTLFGLFRLFRINRYLFTGICIYLVLNVYIISSWWCWNYGYSFGPRVFIEHYPIFFLLLALLLDVKSKVLKITVTACILFFTFLNLFQTYQTLNGILDQDFKTDKQGYWDVFLRLDKGYSGKFYRYPLDESKQNILRKVSFFNDMEKPDTAWINSQTQHGDKAHSGYYSSRVDSRWSSSTGIRKQLSTLPYNKNAFIRASAWFYIPQKGSNSWFTISFAQKGKSINYNTFRLDGYTQHFGQWEYHVFEMYMPELGKKGNDSGTMLEMYYFNDSGIPCYIDDLDIELIEFKKLDRVLDLSWE